MSHEIPNTHPKLSKCNECSKVYLSINIKLIPHPTVTECSIVNCQRYHSMWYDCTRHNNQFSYANKSKMKKHFNTLRLPVKTSILPITQVKIEDSEDSKDYAKCYSSDDDHGLKSYKNFEDTSDFSVSLPMNSHSHFLRVIILNRFPPSMKHHFIYRICISICT